MFNSFITGHWFDTPAKQIWSDQATLQAWLTVEAALAGAQAAAGMIPDSAAQTIARQADASLFDLPRLAREIAFAQHPLVPVLHQFEALCGEPAAGYIHLGATTQNIFDTASALQMRQTHALLTAHLSSSIDSLARLAEQHQSTPMAGRTHGQHALPMSFGFKVAGWIDELMRDQQRLDSRLDDAFVACMGGAIGTFAAMGPRGQDIERRLADALGLKPAGLPIRSSYDRASDYLTALGLLAGTAQRIAQDVVLMQRTEIGEVAEAFHVGKVGSSTMAQKRNPSTALLLISLARMLRARVPLALEAMVRMDEGDSSCTNVTDMLLPEMAILAVSVAQTLSRLVSGLQVFPEAMERNLQLTQGLIVSESVMMRLGEAIGRHRAHQLLYEVANQVQSEGIGFQAAVAQRAASMSVDLPPQALDPHAYMGASAQLAVATSRRAPAPRAMPDPPTNLSPRKPAP